MAPSGTIPALSGMVGAILGSLASGYIYYKAIERQEEIRLKRTRGQYLFEYKSEQLVEIYELLHKVRSLNTDAYTHSTFILSDESAEHHSDININSLQDSVVKSVDISSRLHDNILKVKPLVSDETANHLHLVVRYHTHFHEYFSMLFFELEDSSDSRIRGKIEKDHYKGEYSFTKEELDDVYDSFKEIMDDTIKQVSNEIKEHYTEYERELSD